MRIPTALDEREIWLNETTRRLRMSMSERRNRYGSWRSWYLHGSPEWGARYNKISPQVNALAANLYAPRSTRFALNAGPIAASLQLPMRQSAADRLRLLWNESGADAALTEQTLWSLVFGTTLLKFSWRKGQPQTESIGPGGFGVWRDDLASLTGQQALLFTYRLDAETVRGWLAKEGMSELEVAHWMDILGNGSRDTTEGGGKIAIGQMNPILWNSAPTPGVAGGVADWGSTAAVYSGANTPTLEIEEMWAWDDLANDWRIFQTIEGRLVVADRPNDFLPGRHPFVALSVDPVEGYFWGRSLTAALIPLQAWREKRMNQLDRMFARQANPPGVFSGFRGVTDEKYAGMMRRGTQISAMTPNAKVEILAPKPDELSFTEIGEIDRMFEETVGLAEALQGRQGKNGQAAAAALAAGAGKLTRRMVAVERAVADGATLLFDLARRYDPTQLVDDDGNQFVMAQLPGDIHVEVAAHSASPLYSAAAEETAFALFKAGIASKEDVLDLADPPMAQAIKEGLRKREADQKKEIKEATAQIPAADRGRFFSALFGKKAG